MKTYRQIVKEAGQLLKAHELGKRPKVMHLWNSVEWQEMSQQDASQDAQVNQSDEPVIRLYPRLLQEANAAKAVLREFGILVKMIGGERASAIWEGKLDLPTPEQIDTARNLLQSAEIRQHCRTYAQVKDQYPPKGSAVDRLVFIHIANALLANNLPLEDSVGVDIKEWGPTVEYAHQKKYHSLVPLITAYCPREVCECFGYAFAEWIADDLRCCSESSVTEGLRRILRNVVSRLQPFPTVG